MNLEMLLAGLDHPQPTVRMNTARVIGMVDETRALGVLGQRYKAETDPNVREVMAWAGKRLHEAHQAGYATLDEIFAHFNINAEVEVSETDEAEAELMRQMQDELDTQLMKMQEGAARRQVGTALAAGMIGGAIGGSMLGSSVMKTALTPGANVASSNLSVDGGLGRAAGRTPATIPSQADVSVWVSRLREDLRASVRENAAVELGQLNNPAALPPLAEAFAFDPSPEVREAAQRFGKLIYWNALYWRMERDGSLAQEIARRRGALGLQTAPQPETPPPPTADPRATQEEDISDILRRAEAARARRKKKRR